jgi:hypothetical protein
MVQLIGRHDSIQKHGYIEANQRFIRCEKHLNILPLFGRLRRIFHNLSSLLLDMKHTHTKGKPKAKGVGEGSTPQQPHEPIYSKNQKTRMPLWAKRKITTNQG